MGKDTLANIITSIRNANIDLKKKNVHIASTNIIENIVKILQWDCFIRNIGKHQENQNQPYAID